MRKPQVRVSKESLVVWLVWLDDQIVGRFEIAGDALAYADLLDCDPRARREAGAA